MIHKADEGREKDWSALACSTHYFSKEQLTQSTDSWAHLQPSLELVRMDGTGHDHTEQRPLAPPQPPHLPTHPSAALPQNPGTVDGHGLTGGSGLQGSLSPPHSSGVRVVKELYFTLDSRMLRRVTVPIPGSALDSPFDGLKRLGLRGRGLVSNLCSLTPAPTCGKCGKWEGDKPFQKCGGCRRVHYCSTNRAKADWKLRHRAECRKSGAA